MKDIDIFDIQLFYTNQKGGMCCYREGNKSIRLFEFQNIFGKQVEPDFPDMVCTQTLYYGETLGVKEKGQYLKHGGTGIGVWKYYREDGTINYSKDLDQHYRVTWELLEQILKDNDISLLTADSIFRYYDEEKDTSMWTIVIKIAWDKGCRYVFDARTGEMLSKEIIDMRKEL